MDGDGKRSFWFYLCASVVKVLFGKLLWRSFGGLYVERFLSFWGGSIALWSFFLIPEMFPTNSSRSANNFSTSAQQFPQGTPFVNLIKYHRSKLTGLQWFCPNQQRTNSITKYMLLKSPQLEITRAAPQKMHRFVMFQRLIWFNFISIDSVKRSLVVVAPPRALFEIWPQLVVVVVVVPQTKPKNGLRV